MELIDTHAHLYLRDFRDDIEAVIQRARESGVKRIVLPNIDSQTIEPMLHLAEGYPDLFIPLMGLHPTHVKENYRSELESIFKVFEEREFPGVGEIGIDLYWDKKFFNEQADVFEQQVVFAISKNLPVIIHARESIREILDTLHKGSCAGARGIFHAFTGNGDEAREIIDLGFKLGIGGIVTFKNAGLDKVLKDIAPEHLVLETDSPYLAPTPYRGKRNESAYVKLVAEKLAGIYGLPVEKIAEMTTSNAEQVFGI